MFWYPAVTATTSDYIRSAVKIESSAKSALDPHVAAAVTPYVAQDLPDLDLVVANVTTVKPERTFWDKVIILHGLRQWHDRRGELRHGGQRVSRHYYDVHQLMHAAPAHGWHADHALAIDCARHARLFFGSIDLGLDTAAPGTFTLTPSPAMQDALTRDYEAMAGMVFGEMPPLGVVLAPVEKLDRDQRRCGAVTANDTNEQYGAGSCAIATAATVESSASFRRTRQCPGNRCLTHRGATWARSTIFLRRGRTHALRNSQADHHSARRRVDHVFQINLARGRHSLPEPDQLVIARLRASHRKLDLNWK
ncbi:nucleotidyl transferase AbiEii/AbiGii toxin family protein [Methylibium sp.]|uniref:nucleotidyl transferase AbiEii/AbiGii toxin family protein n=1 Tax=Methylibium sp. TaxID=2067992 RepID=UPI0025ED4377|nr:nucleotidyl transferase AbiEii/AbiGii toxin family protein [Methylibium sp.]